MVKSETSGRRCAVSQWRQQRFRSSGKKGYCRHSSCNIVVAVCARLYSLCRSCTRTFRRISLPLTTRMCICCNGTAVSVLCNRSSSRFSHSSPARRISLPLPCPLALRPQQFRPHFHRRFCQRLLCHAAVRPRHLPQPHRVCAPLLLLWRSPASLYQGLHQVCHTPMPKLRLSDPACAQLDSRALALARCCPGRLPRRHVLSHHVCWSRVSPQPSVLLAPSRCQHIVV